jgi:hypothetical protein
MRPTVWLALLVASAVALNSCSALGAPPPVTYHGHVYQGYGGPVVNGFAVAGTFAPGFDPFDYEYVYGIDEWGNMDQTHYSDAVADGNFLPIGGGTWTDESGYFWGSGASSAAPGTPVYLFVFDDSNPDLAANFGLATSTDPSYRLSASGYASVDATLANDFVFGWSSGDGIAVNVLPFPEPATSTLALLAMAGLPLARGCHRRNAA